MKVIIDEMWIKLRNRMQKDLDKITKRNDIDDQHFIKIYTKQIAEINQTLEKRHNKKERIIK